MNREQNKGRTIIIVIITILIVLIIYLTYKIKTPLINTFLPFIVSLVIAYLLNPLVSYMEHKGVPKTLSIILTYIVLLSGIIIIILFIIPLFINEISS
ncbi:MAG TPA: AI-2E family transporter, partial [Thermoanaerobacterales bacterium]|nr:AI-2E family transporter [Thermoanaerobacterales bacterium]